MDKLKDWKGKSLKEIWADTERYFDMLRDNQAFDMLDALREKDNPCYNLSGVRFVSSDGSWVRNEGSALQ